MSKLIGRELTEKLLFDYYFLSSQREDDIFSPFPFYIDKDVLDKMNYSARILDGLVHDIINNIGTKHKKFKSYMGDFYNKELLLNIKTPVTPVFWTRYDAFIRENGQDIFFSEFNYDKPCMQKEIAASSLLKLHNDPNIDFCNDFKREFLNIMDYKFNKSYEKINVAILISPSHYEELHLANFYIDIMKDCSNLNFSIVGPNNLYVEKGKVYAFSKEVHVLLRQFPTEHFHEINHIDEIIELFKRGEFLIINDPRVIIGQAKSLFAYLWDLTETNLIDEKQKKVIKETLPYTKLFSEEYVDTLIKNKDKFVIKAIYGRYSEEVYIGTLLTEDEWVKTIDYVIENNLKNPHIIQEFCPIHKENILASNGERYISTEAHGNFGIYITKGKCSGVGLRLSEDYLSRDDSIWLSSIGVRDKNNLSITCNNVSWEKINEKAIFEYDFTGEYTRDSKYFLTDYLTLSNSLYNELKEKTNEIVALINKTYDFIKLNLEGFCSILGINEELIPLIKNEISKVNTVLGRLDFTVDSKGDLKLLEFNCETPAGMVESMGLTELIKKESNLKLFNPNEKLSESIKKTFKNILRDFSSKKPIKTIGFLTNTYYEDWYNTKILHDIACELPFDVVIGNIYDVTVENNKLSLQGKELDAVYRYFPLNWFLSDFENSKEILSALKENTLSINEPKTIVYQSKAFFAVIYELLNTDFYTLSEKQLIKTYIPRTSLDYLDLQTHDFCIKPFLEREGYGVEFNYENVDLSKFNDCIYQERVDIQPIDIYIEGFRYKKRKSLFPIIGTFVSGNEFCGIYTRVGENVTNMWAKFVATYVEK
ncbi:hypothetical protein ADU90_09235 [Clostridium botulinum]|uniref:glutathionylspermidine synthase family protein n=1 Tax=Clostridium botulinum TaxID=1491 RepID=UPI0006A45EBF|nr:glutathionylspermidine synthase family protein [Clostridium botulinum]KOC50601.1 hypothetical protein ADU89_14485 [Clostridium botulinum]KOC56032.1 hypothetical protein ADU90_09235 [Clostridium botulinum]